MLLGIVDALGGVGNGGRGADPHVVVELRRDGHVRLRADGRGVGREDDLDALEPADVAVADELDGVVLNAEGAELRVSAGGDA